MYSTGAWGVYHTPLEFENKAAKLGHPMDDLSAIIHDELIKCVGRVLEAGPIQTLRRRASKLRWILQKKQHLAGDNHAAMANLDEYAAKVSKGKDLALLCHLLEVTGFPDHQLGEHLVHGWPVIGRPSASHVFEHDPRNPDFTEEELLSRSKWSNKALWSKVRQSSDVQLDRDLWQQALEERDAGWLTGPWRTLEEAQVNFEKPIVLSRRFPLPQGDKVRAIDDFSESGVNGAFSLDEKVTTMNLDAIAATIRLIFQGLSSRSIQLTLINGELLSYTVSPIWFESGGDLTQLYGRLLDLKSAYKQLFVAKKDRHLACITLWDPSSSSPAIFGQVTLPFGATSSVHSFNRVARAIWWIGIRLLDLIWLHYFNDHTMFDIGLLQDSSQKTAELFLESIGWGFATSDKKRKPASAVFQVLGAEIDPTNFKLGKACVKNKQDRMNSINASLDALDVGNFVMRRSLESLRGELLFANQMVFGYGLRLALANLRLESRTTDKDDARLRDFIRLWLRSAVPRELGCIQGEVVRVYTDGACESNGELVSCGAVMFRDGFQPEIFGVKVDDEIVRHWRNGGDKLQVIGQAELFPVLLVKAVWGSRLEGKGAIVFLDNESAKCACIKGWSPAKASNDTLRAIGLSSPEYPPLLTLQMQHPD